MCACANKGEKFSDRTRGRSLVIEQGGELFDFLEFQKLVVHRALIFESFKNMLCTEFQKLMHW